MFVEIKKNRIIFENFYIFAAVSTIWIIYLFHLVSLCKFCFVIYRHIVPRGEGPNCPWAESFLLCSTCTSFTLSVFQNTQSKKDSERDDNARLEQTEDKIKLVSQRRVKKNQWNIYNSNNLKIKSHKLLFTHITFLYNMRKKPVNRPLSGVCEEKKNGDWAESAEWGLGRGEGEVAFFPGLTQVTNFW